MAKREYVIEQVHDGEVIWYEENGYRISFMADPENTEYQQYLKDQQDAKE